MKQMQIQTNTVEPMKLLLHISYIGTDFCGYQVQTNKRTVQAELNRAAKELFGFDCDIVGCSRTDSGVHADMFCATVAKKGTDILPTALPASRIPLAFSAHLPCDLSVCNAAFVPAAFHARYDVVGKEYRYRFYTRSVRNPFENNRAWHLPTVGDAQALARMQSAALHFCGKHDFSAFMAAGSHVQNTERTVFHASVTKEEDHLLLFRVSADGFLYNMVRIMAGTLAEIGTGKYEPWEIKDILASRDRQNAGMTAPACGLYLSHVIYPYDPFSESSKMP